MNGCFRSRRWRSLACRRLGAGDGASQIVEFALSLPLLVLFVVGIFDFSGALPILPMLSATPRPRRL
jgi:Flp pilus assembly protein TadG